jgi:hypothetical protein
MSQETRLVRKSRRRKHVPNSLDAGRYMLLNPLTSSVALGERFEATLPDIEAYLARL